jgi:hypothetical protein
MSVLYNEFCFISQYYGTKHYLYPFIITIQQLYPLLMQTVKIMANLDWDLITKHLVRTSDQKSCGNIIAEYKDDIFVIKGETVESHEYMIPKTKVDHYDGKELFLCMPYES